MKKEGEEKNFKRKNDQKDFDEEIFSTSKKIFFGNEEIKYPVSQLEFGKKEKNSGKKVALFFPPLISFDKIAWLKKLLLGQGKNIELIEYFIQKHGAELTYIFSVFNENTGFNCDFISKIEYESSIPNNGYV